MIFFNFREGFYDDVIFTFNWFLCSKVKIKIINNKGKDLRLTMVTFWNLLALECSLKHQRNQNILKSPFRQREAYFRFFFLLADRYWLILKLPNSFSTFNNDFSCPKPSFKFDRLLSKYRIIFGHRSKSEKVTHKNGRLDIFYHTQKTLKLTFKFEP